MSAEYNQIPRSISEEYSPASLGQISEIPDTSSFEDREAILARSLEHYAFYEATIQNIRSYLAREYRGDTMHNPNLVYDSYSRKERTMQYRDIGEWEFVRDERGSYVPHSSELVIRDQFIERTHHHIQVTHWVEGEQYVATPSGEVVPAGAFIEGLSGPETVITFETYVWPDGHYVPTGTVYKTEAEPMQVIFEDTKVSA